MANRVASDRRRNRPKQPRRYGEDSTKAGDHEQRRAVQNRLRQVKEEYNLSNAALAERLRVVTRQGVDAWFDPYRLVLPRGEALLAFAKLPVSVDWLLTGTGSLSGDMPADGLRASIVSDLQAKYPESAAEVEALVPYLGVLKATLLGEAEKGFLARLARKKRAMADAVWSDVRQALPANKRALFNWAISLERGGDGMSKAKKVPSRIRKRATSRGASLAESRQAEEESR